ncbi:MAG: HlyC/CorC family transporter [Thermodesulfobacteria bacterium]|nr:HlyC/CorC family transporter [Thermodesulfobacteriota bacterium]
MLNALISFAIFICTEAYFSLTEIAFISAERFLIESLSSRHLGARLYKKFWKHPETLFTTTLMGTTLSIAGNGIFTSYFLIKSLGNLGILISSSILPVSMIIFGQMIPKTIGKRLSYPLVLYLLPPLYLISFLFLPLSLINSLISNKFLKNREKNPLFLTRFREVFLTFVHYEKEIDIKEKELMQKIVEFARKKVFQIMIPATQVKALPVSATVKDAIEFSKKYNFSYIPLYQGSINNIVGIVKVQHLIGSSLMKGNLPLKDFSQPPYFVPEVAYAHEVLSQLQKRGIEIAVVVDEYGSTTGIVTIEDLVEEVLGEFRDALDYYVPEYTQVSKNTYIVKGYIEIEKLAELGIPIPIRRDYETLNGFIYHLIGRIPKEGEVIHYKNVELKILKAKPQTIEEVLVKVKR